jgi:hypothetical protein
MIGMMFICIMNSLYNNINGSYTYEQYGAVCRYRLLPSTRCQSVVHSTRYMLAVNLNLYSYRDIALNNHPALQHQNPNQAYQVFSQAA